MRRPEAERVIILLVLLLIGRLLLTVGLLIGGLLLLLAIGLIRLRVFEQVVGLVDLLQALLGLGVVRVQIRVILPRLLAIGLLYLVGRGRAGNAEDVVRVFSHENLLG